MTDTYTTPEQIPEDRPATPADPGVPAAFADHPATPAPEFLRGSWSGDDIEDARRQLEESLDGRQFRARPASGDFAYRFATAGDARLSVQTGTFRGHLQGVIPWSRDYVVSWFQAGSVTIDYPRGQLTSVGARPFLTPTETSFSFAMTPHRHGIVQIDATFLEDIAAERHGGPSQRIVFDYDAVPSDEDLAAWRKVLGDVTPIIVAEGSSGAARLAAQTLLVLALLDLFPWRAVDVPVAIRTERTRRLRLAAEYVHAHAHEPITSADIAVASGLHPRSLQAQMSEHLGASPTGYLRTVRLDRVRQDLLSGRPGETRVSEAARRWCFGNLGRFSAAYVDRFGELPRETLAR